MAAEEVKEVETTAKTESVSKAQYEKELAAMQAEIERYKNAVTKANGEVAELKRKHNASLSEEDRAKAELQEQLETLKAERDAYKRNEEIANHKAKYISIGYDAELAAETAKALVDNDAEKLFENTKKFLEAHDKTMKADLLRQTPFPATGVVPHSYTNQADKSEIDAMIANGNRENAARVIREAQLKNKGD